ncbi:MAG: TetR/AcrR family transcriptional regulator [Planctomycetes bacterium]|nr:TetR/AcrR family transcriptional regulator [Planctomycetota bacterium]
MPRPDQSAKRRKRLLPIIAQAFAELGYGRATTAELAQRCKVRENILYRLWPNKKAMFVASIDYVYEQSAATWREILADIDDSADAAGRLLKHEAEHHGESGLHRIILAGLSQTDEPEIRDALRSMYGRFHRFIRAQIVAHRKGEDNGTLPDATASAWAIVGLGNLANISRELGLLTDRGRKRLFSDAGRLLLGGKSS